MKKILFILFAISFFVLSSCESTPEKAPKPPAPEPVAAIQPEPELEPEPEPEEEQIALEDEINDADITIADEPPEEISEAELEIEVEIEIAAAEETPAAVQAAPVSQSPAPPSLPPAPLPEIEIEVEAEEETKAEEKTELAQETVAPETYRPGFPPAPAHTPDSLLQMGLTPLDKELIYSRIIHATVGQIAEIPFRGTGWIYLGEIASRRGIAYSSRRNDPEGQSFIFTLEAPGAYTLKFYRQDFIRDYIINDHVQVIVTEAPAGTAGWHQPSERGRVVAQPRWPSALEEAQIRSGSRIPAEPFVTTGDASAREAAPAQTPSRETPSQPAAATQPQSSAAAAQPAQRPAATPQPAQSPAASTQPAQQPAVTQPQVQTAPPVTASAQQNQSAENAEIMPTPAREKLPLDETIQKAKESFEAGNTQAAIALLEQLMEDYPGGSDELYWQLGQYYEANSPSRNILLSINYYRRLVNEYPQSSRYNDARRRIAYLERFYINIQ